MNDDLKYRPRDELTAGRSGIDTLLACLSVLLGVLTMAIAVWSVEGAKWISPQPSLLLTLFLASAIAITASNRHLPAWVGIPAMISIGLAVVLWQSVMLFKPADGLSAFQVWLRSINNMDPSQNSIFFALFLLLIVWLFSVISIWYLIRRRNAWVTVVLGTLVLLINLANLPRENYYYFVLFFVAAVIFLGITYIVKIRQIFQERRYFKQGAVYFSLAITGIAVASVSLAYFLPEPSLDNTGINIDNATVNGKSLDDLWINVFSSVQSKWNYVKSDDQAKLLFNTPQSTDNTIYFIISDEKSEYWAVRSYDSYQGWGWTSSAENKTDLSTDTHIDYGDIAAGQTLNYAVENLEKTDVVLIQGNIIAADIPLQLHTLDSAQNSPDITAVTAIQIMHPYQTYQLETDITTTEASDLASAGTDYPAWVAGRYLQLPAVLPRRISRLARGITANAKTPYQKILAIKNYLDTLTYDLNAPSPPEGSDGVDYFLFNSKSGVCTNFASAMTVMLRSVNVPARICTGYLSGEQDKSTGKYLVRGKYAHAWVQVYFPNYGWINIEATPVGRPVAAQKEIGTVESTPSDNGLALSQGSQLPWWMQDATPTSSSQRSPAVDASQPVKKFPVAVLYTFAGVIAALIVIVIVKGVFNRWLTGLERIESPAQAYTRMCYIAGLGKSGPMDNETPLEFGTRLSGHLPDKKADIETIVNLYIDSKYSPRREMNEFQKVRLQSTWVHLCPMVFKHSLQLKKWLPVRFVLVKWLEE